MKGILIPRKIMSTARNGVYDELFIRRHQTMRALFLELGVSYNTPGIIKYPFWQLTAKNPKATYACVNYGEVVGPKEIERQAVYINGDIGKLLDELAQKTGGSENAGA